MRPTGPCTVQSGDLTYLKNDLNRTRAGAVTWSLTLMVNGAPCISLLAASFVPRNTRCIIVPSPDHNFSVETHLRLVTFLMTTNSMWFRNNPDHVLSQRRLYRIHPTQKMMERTTPSYPRKYPTRYHPTHLRLLAHRRKLMLLHVLDVVHNEPLT